MHSTTLGGLAPASVAAFLTFAAMAQGPITIGNLVVVRVGDGAAALSNASTATFLDEYTPSGVFVQSIPMPTTASGANQPLTNSGTATSEGFVTVSTNGLYLLLGGYAVPTGVASIATTPNPPNGRVIGRIDLAGNVDTSTVLGDAYNNGNIRSVASDDGQRFWTSGSNEGVRFVANLGAATSLVIGGNPVNNRVVNLYNGQLYASANSGAFRNVFTIGTGLSTLPGQVATLLPGLPSVTGQSVYDFHFASPTVLYLADDNTNGSGGIQKWELIAGTWTFQYAFAFSATHGCRGLTGFTQNGVTTLWATANTGTSSTTLVTVVDTGPASVVSSLATPATNTAFRGVRYVGLPTTLTRIPATCGAADIIATGTGQIGTDVTTTVLNPLGIPFVGYGVLPLSAPFCNCTIVHEFAVLFTGPQHTFPIPNNPTLMGIAVYSQGLDFLAPGGCPDPLLTLTDGYAFIVQ
jgi:hypothetical protein